MEIERIHEIEQAMGVNRSEVLRLGVSILFLAGIILYVGSRGEVSPMLIIAGMIGGDVVNWDKMGQIAPSWVISPVLGGLIAAGFLYLIKRTITYQDDMLTSARRMIRGIMLP